ncbi:WD40 repeat domain-containing protein [Myxococcus sp. CA039A]|uniref:WD40 repeat domain-containing protein n=1 Tax=Myxococcus sp. CA039A TaxID=2741737 RepID=UPI00157B406A|nr:hypothetical protein [Myxococcus sp. CA039A]NTX50748.1 hypothetical protein [Myxococcus sp. CA039A]
MPGPFIDLHALNHSSDEALESLLKQADFSHFEAHRDLPSLRARLRRLQGRRGVTDLHRWVSERVLDMGARLVETPHSSGAQSSFALSPSGRHLAVASLRVDAWFGFFGGDVRIWELATGRVVASHGFDKGVASRRVSSCIQWSPSGQWLGVVFNDVVIGALRPFSEGPPSFKVDVTRRWGSPDPRYVKRPEDVKNLGHLPAWCWSPDETRLFISTPGPENGLGCIVPFREGASLNDDCADVRWCPPPPVPPRDRPNPDTWVRWSRDGSRVHGYRFTPGGDWDEEAFDYVGTGGASSTDVASGTSQFQLGGVKPPIAFSPDGARLVHDDQRLELIDGHTGEHLATLVERIPGKQPHVGISEVVWSSDGRRLAVLMDDYVHPTVCIFEDEAFLCRLKLSALAHPSDQTDTHRWAWSPDGTVAACLTTDGGVELWAIGRKPRRLRRLTAVKGLQGLLWGGDDTLVGIGPSALAFWSASNGELRTQASFDLEAGRLPPPASWCPWPEKPGQFLPTERGWAFTHVRSDGTVSCPPGLLEKLERRLMFAVAGQYAWPWSWALGTRHTRLEDGARAHAVKHPTPPPGELPTNHYQAQPVFTRGPDLCRDNLTPYIGQVMLVRFGYHGLVTDLATLLEVTGKGVRLRTQGRIGPGPEEVLPYSSIGWMGPAVQLEAPESLAGAPEDSR